MPNVIIPTYDRADVLPRAIDSVLAQTFTDWDLIVADDGSTDNTLTVVEAYATRGAAIRYPCQENQKQAAARNLGITHAAASTLPLWIPRYLAAKKDL